MEANNKGIRVYFPLIIAISVIVGIFAGRFFYGSNAENRFIIIPKANKLDNVLNYIENEYVDEVSKAELIEQVIPKLLEDLDPHSQYIPAVELEKVNEPLEGNFSGVGIQFNMLNDTLVVIQTVANGPSQKVGILAGDRIIRVDGTQVAGMKLPSDSIVRRLRGPKGSSVQVAVLRRSIKDTITFDIIRDNIPLYSVDVAYMLSEKTGFLRLNKFSATTEQEFASSIGKLRGLGMERVVIDLRENGGGYMNAAVFIADQFLNGNELIVYTQGKARAKQEFRSSPGGLCTDLEVAVLIDENSASASEILAGAIQDNDRGTIIGRRSFGKGLVQEQKPLSDGSALRLTIARYYTPTGRSIQRPYENGLEDYYSDIEARYMHGELEIADSNKFADSLRFTTPGGRTVFGGGGIMPDVFVPIDTFGISPFYIHVRNQGLIYRFTLNYADENRKVLSAFETYGDFVEYLDKANIVKRFAAFAAEQGVKASPADLKTSQEILKVQLEAYIARNFLDNDGFFPIIQSIDPTLQKALETIDKQVSETAAMRKYLQPFGALIFLLPHWHCDSYSQQKGHVKNAAQAERKNEQAEKLRKKAYHHIRKETIKRRRNMQTPETKLRMREADKRAERYNNLDEKGLMERLFKKRPPRKRNKD